MRLCQNDYIDCKNLIINNKSKLSVTKSDVISVGDDNNQNESFYSEFENFVINYGKHHPELGRVRKNILFNRIRKDRYDTYKAESSDIKSTGGSFMSSVDVRPVVEEQFKYDKFPSLASSFPKSMLMDFSRILNKPFNIGSFKWSTTDLSGSNIATISFPSDIVNINPLARIPFDAAALYRTKMRVIAQVSGTPLHAGCVIISALPVPGATGTPIIAIPNALLSAPHCFLSANSSSVASIVFPFYAPTCLLDTDTSVNHGTRQFAGTNNFGNLYVNVLSPLVASTAASTSVTINIQVEFVDPEFYIPHTDAQFALPSFKAESSSVSSILSNGLNSVAKGFKTLTGDFIDNVRGGIREYTGLHNPNNSVISDREVVGYRNFPNTVDSIVHFEKLDPYTQFDAIVDDPVFQTCEDEMDMNFILGKKYFAGSFLLNQADASGKCLFSRPIHPLGFPDVTPLSLATRGFGGSHPLHCFGLMSRFWSGSLQLHIMSVMSNFHFAKLAVVRDYSPSSLYKTAQPVFNDVMSFPVDILEFSAGGQIHSVDLPFCSVNKVLPITYDRGAIALQHGMLNIYTVQPLVVSGNVSNSVEFKVFVSAKPDFKFYGYATVPYDFVSTFTPATFIAESNLLSNGIQTNITVDSSAINNTSLDNIDNSSDLHRPIVSIRDYARRMHKVLETISVSPQFDSAFGDIRVFDIYNLLFIRSGGQQGYHRQGNSSILPLLAAYFYGVRCGIKFKIVIKGTSGASAKYIPPGYNIPDLQGSGILGKPSQIRASDITPVNPTASIQSLVYAQLSDTITDNARTLAPYQEIAVTNIYDSQSYVVGSGLEYAYHNSSCLLEFEIPYMSMFNFAAIDNYYNHVQPPSQLDGNRVDASKGLGQLVIYYPQAELTGAAYITQIFVGLTDESRFGLQVNCPAITFESMLVDNQGFISYNPYNYKGPDVIGPGYPIAAETTGTISWPGAYFST